MTITAAVATGAAASLVAVVHLVVALPRLTEPEDDPTDAFTKPSYASLARPRTYVAAALLGLLAGSLVPLATPATRGLWFVLASAVAALVVIDGLTTYLPFELTALSAGELVAAGLVGSLLTGEWDWWLRALGGAIAGWSLFWAVWRLGRGLGFGDVRLAAFIGLTAASLSWQVWWAALLMGSVVGAVVGLITLVIRRWRPSPLGAAFAYGPALWVGPWVALLLS
ncbi:MAG TPA: A24 family peptidase [Propionibacteriaceae bacterium]|nr:A24 family peptidase [Propionibacteriaceae bacterium]